MNLDVNMPFAMVDQNSVESPADKMVYNLEIKFTNSKKTTSDSEFGENTLDMWAWKLPVYKIGSLNIGRAFNFFVRGYLCNFVINIHFYQSSHTHIGFSLIFLSPHLPTPLAIRFPSFYAFLCHYSLPSFAILLELKIGSFVAGFGDAGGEEPPVTEQRGVVRKWRDSNSEDGYSNLVSTSNATDLLDVQKKKKAEKEASNEKLKRPRMKSGHTPQSPVKSGK
uniref:uncharacterized protein LOC122591714 n=1 Tax=Erigeron canadensis TaxID=72917 RepID=UPI001CB8D2B7|nr:uncharacterized protein LOC122591714 [Erigeron canadensis]